MARHIHLIENYRPRLLEARPTILAVDPGQSRNDRTGLSYLMGQYEVRFFNHGDYTMGSDHFHAENDDVAIRYTARLLKSPFGKGHEIWDGERLVHRELYHK
jgi:hypothetical protein